MTSIFTKMVEQRSLGFILKQPFTKSSRITTDVELKPTDNELRQKKVDPDILLVESVVESTTGRRRYPLAIANFLEVLLEIRHRDFFFRSSSFRSVDPFCEGESTADDYVPTRNAMR